MPKGLRSQFNQLAREIQFPTQFFDDVEYQSVPFGFTSFHRFRNILPWRILSRSFGSITMKSEFLTVQNSRF